jgi:hypothetical protein
MASDGDARSHDVITPRGLALVTLWAVGLALSYVIGGWLGAHMLVGYRHETERIRQFLIRTETVGGTAPPALDGAHPVAVGIFVNRMDDIDVHQGAWTADFDIWFRWHDGGLSPGETFQIVNGDIKHREKIESYSAGDLRYARYRVQARLSMSFDPGRFPFSDEAMTIQVEDATHGAAEVRYVADERASGVGRFAAPQGFVLQKWLSMVKYYRYGSNLGHPGPERAAAVVQARYVFAVIGAPPSWATHLKNFQALFASVAISLIVFFIRPIHVDPRFGLSVGAAFAAITNNILVATSIPTVDRFTLTSMVNLVGLATIFMNLVESALALYVEDTLGNERLRVLLDRISFVIFVSGSVALNVIFPVASLG